MSESLARAREIDRLLAQDTQLEPSSDHRAIGCYLDDIIASLSKLREQHFGDVKPQPHAGADVATASIPLSTASSGGIIKPDDD